MANDSGNFIFDLNNVFLDKVPDGGEERLEIKVWTVGGKFEEALVQTTQTQPIPDIQIEK